MISMTNASKPIRKRNIVQMPVSIIIFNKIMSIQMNFEQKNLPEKLELEYYKDGSEYLAALVQETCSIKVPKNAKCIPTSVLPI